MAQAKNRHIKRAAAQVVNRVNAFAAVVQAVSNRSGGGLVDQTQHIQAGHLRRIFGGLSLRVVKVGGHGDDRAVYVIVERVFGALAQRGQYFSAHLDRRLLAFNGLQSQHAGFVDQRIREAGSVGNIGDTTAHETLDRDDGVLRIIGLCRQSIVADGAFAVAQITHRRRQYHAPLIVRQAFGHAVAHAGHQ